MKKRTKKRDPLAGRDPTMQLYRAVVRYVEAHGGTVAVVGGVGMMEELLPLRYSLVVRCTGKPPKFEKKGAP